MEPTASVLLNRLIVRGRLRHLQVLLVVAELGSVRSTADAIGMTQSAVTQSLAYLERMLDVALFERHARGMRPTAACRALIPAARQVMRGATQGAEQLAALHHAGEGQVRLAASASALHGLLVGALPAFHAAHPQVQVHLHEAEGEEQLMAIVRGEVDLVACRQPAVVPEGWTFQPLMEDRLAVLCAADHALAGRLAGWKALGGCIWLMTPVGSLARRKFDELLQARFPSPPRLHPLVGRSVVLMQQLLAAPDTMALLPLSVLRHAVQRGELAEVRTRERMALEPLGLLLPTAGAGGSTQRLAQWLARAAQAAPDRAAGRPPRGT